MLINKPIVYSWRKDLVTLIEGIITTKIKTYIKDKEGVPFFDIIFNDYQLYDYQTVGIQNFPFYLMRITSVSELFGNNELSSNDNIAAFGGARMVEFSIYICFPNISYPLKKRIEEVFTRIEELNLFIGNQVFNASGSNIIIMGETYTMEGIQTCAEGQYRVMVYESYVPINYIDEKLDGVKILLDKK